MLTRRTFTAALAALLVPWRKARAETIQTASTGSFTATGRLESFTFSAGPVPTDGLIMAGDLSTGYVKFPDAVDGWYRLTFPLDRE